MNRLRKFNKRLIEHQNNRKHYIRTWLNNKEEDEKGESKNDGDSEEIIRNNARIEVWEAYGLKKMLMKESDNGFVNSLIDKICNEDDFDYDYDLKKCREGVEEYFSNGNCYIKLTNYQQIIKNEVVEIFNVLLPIFNQFLFNKEIEFDYYMEVLINVIQAYNIIFPWSLFLANMKFRYKFNKLVKSSPTDLVENLPNDSNYFTDPNSLNFLNRFVNKEHFESIDRTPLTSIYKIYVLYELDNYFMDSLQEYYFYYVKLNKKIKKSSILNNDYSSNQFNSSSIYDQEKPDTVKLHIEDRHLQALPSHKLNVLDRNKVAMTNINNSFNDIKIKDVQKYYNVNELNIEEKQNILNLTSSFSKINLCFNENSNSDKGKDNTKGANKIKSGIIFAIDGSNENNQPITQNFQQYGTESPNYYSTMFPR